MDREPEDTGNGAAERAARIAIAVAALAAIWLAWWAAGGVTREAALQPKAGFRKSAEAWTAPVPRELRGRIDPATAIVWEDDIPLWRPSARKVVEAGEPGTCFVRRGVIVFLPSDGGDPNANGRTYTLRGPATLPWGWLAAVGAVVAALQLYALRRGARMGGGAGWTGAWSATVCLVAFALRAGWIWLHPEFNDGFMLAKGCPYSDAHAWLELAHSLAQGFGFEGTFATQRPLYPMLLATLPGMGGSGLFSAQLLNAGAGALTAALFGAMAASVAGRAAGIGVAAVVAFTGFQAPMLPLSMSETVAMAFVAIGLLMIWRGACTGRRALLAAGGGLLALGNLVCTFTLMALVLMVLAAGVAGARSRGRWPALFVHGGMVALGAAVVLGPWVIRQRTVHGVATVSLQAAEMLYAPLSEAGRFSAGLVREPAKAGVPDEPAARYRFFSSRWREGVAADPGGYASTIASNLGEFFAVFSLDAVPLRALLVLVAAATAWRLAGRGAGARAWLAGAVLGAGVWSIGWWPAGWGLLVVAAAAVATPSAPRRWLALLMIALVSGVGVMDALTGNSITRRFWTAGEGAVVVLTVMAVVHGVEGLSHLVTRGRSGEVDSDSCRAPVGWFATTAAVAMVAWAVAATGWTLARTAIGARDPDWPASVSLDASAAWSETLRRLGRPPVPAQDPRVWVEPVEFTGRGCRLAQNESIHHWSRAFAVRPESRSVVFVRVIPNRLLRCLQMRGESWLPDRTGRFVVVGVRNFDPNAPLGHETEMIETLAVIPVGKNGGLEAPDFRAASIFEPTAVARQIMGW